MNNSSGPKIWFHAALAAVVAFLLYFCLFWGIPFDFNKDVTMVYGSVRGTAFSTLMRDLFNPLTPNWFYAENFAHLRPGQYLIAKIMDLFGVFDLPALHLFTFFSIALLAGAIFYILHHVTQSLLFAWLGALLYLTFPTHLYSLLSISPFDMQFLQLFLLVIILLPYWNTLRREDLSPKAFAWRMAVVVLLIWLDIKVHSSAKVLPGILLAITLVFLALRRIQRQSIPRRLFWALGVLMISFILVVPLAPQTNVSAKDQQATHLRWDYALRRTFQSRTEGPFVLATWHRPPPGSLTENYGFWLGWTFWLALLAAVLARLQRLRTVDPDDFFWPIALWFMVSLAGFAIGAPTLDHNNRYLNHGLMPSVLLLFLCLGSLWKSSKPMTRPLKTLLAGLLLLTICQNSIILTGWIRHAAGLAWAIVQADTIVYKDQKGTAPQDLLELHAFHFQMRGDTLLAQWEGNEKDRYTTLAQALDKHGQCYYLSHEANPPEIKILEIQGAHVRLLKEIRFYDAPTMAFRLFKRLKTAIGRDPGGKAIFVYSVVK